MSRRRLGAFAFVILHLPFLAACTTEAEKPPVTPPAVRVGAENVVTVGHDTDRAAGGEVRLRVLELDDQVDDEPELASHLRVVGG